MQRPPRPPPVSCVRSVSPDAIGSAAIRSLELDQIVDVQLD